jgi:iron-sulfur cluster assembly accessory protein
MTQLLSIKSNRPQKVVDLTETAGAKVAELIAGEGDPDLALRMAVRPGGCSGFSYEMFFDSQVDDTDYVTEHGSVRLVVDSESMTMLDGAEVDYRDGLQGAGFHVRNPNETRSCGCGKSFS